MKKKLLKIKAMKKHIFINSEKLTYKAEIRNGGTGLGGWGLIVGGLEMKPPAAGGLGVEPPALENFFSKIT